MKERKKEYDHKMLKGKKVKVCRYEGTDTWQICEEQDDN